MSFPLQVECAGVTQLAFQVQGNVVEELPQHTVAEAIVVQVHLQHSASIQQLTGSGQPVVAVLSDWHPLFLCNRV